MDEGKAPEVEKGASDGGMIAKAKPSRSPSGSRSRSRSHSPRRRRSRSRSRSPHRRRSRHSRHRHSHRRHRRRSYSRSRSPSYDRRRRHRDDRRRRDSSRDRRGRYDRDRRDRRDTRDRGRDGRDGRDGGKRKDNSWRKRSPSADSTERAERETRDIRTIFVSQLVMRASEKDVKRYFEQVGEVRNVELVTDRSGRSKGIAYVEFKNLETVAASGLLNGQNFCMKHKACTCSGFPILVKASEAHKNHQHEAEERAKRMAMVSALAASGGAGAAGAGAGVPGELGATAASMVAADLAQVNAPLSHGVPSANRLYVGNLSSKVTESELRAVFSPFGQIDSVSLRMEPGRPLGYGFVHYRSADAALSAITKANGLELHGEAIKVNTVNEPSDNTSNDWKLDAGSGAVSMNSAQRVQLMQRLSGVRPAAAAAPVAPAAPPTPKVQPMQGEPSRCFIVRNMFNPAEETEKHWDREIMEDVEDECAKFGTLVHIHVDKLSAGHVYLMFKEVQGGRNGATALHGRFFARRMLSCDYIPVSKYLQKFPDAEK